MGIIDRARKNLARLNDKSSGQFRKVEFFNPRMFKPEDEDFDLVRFICPPYLDDDEHDPWISSMQYSLPLPDGSVHMTDAPSHFDLEDPVPEIQQQLMASDAQKDKDLAKRLNAKDSFIALVVDQRETDRGVQIWRFGAQVMKQLLEFIGDDDYNLFWDIKKGHDVKVRKVKTGPQPMNVEYSVKLRPKPTELENAEEFLQQASEIDLARYVICETPETLIEILDGKYDKEAAKERRKIRDAEFRPPIPYFLKRDSDVTKEEVEQKKRVAEEDENFDPDTRSKLSPLEAARGKFLEKEVKFKYVDDDGDTVDATGVVDDVEEQSGDILLIVKVGEELFEVDPEKATIVETVRKAAPRKAEKTEKQSGVLSRLDAMKNKKGSEE